ncbi:MAG: serine/threonine protein kinase [Gemmataceae bacterium]|nr:serine/threonine protein kinase [Gemmataceae bacterium]
MNLVAACPNLQQLKSLVQGRLPFDEVEPMAQHVEWCRRCVHTIQLLNVDDTLVELIRRQPASGAKAPDAVLESMMNRLRGLQPLIVGSSASGIDPENYDFLAPAQGAGELGRLAQYRILRILGAGGMGVVFQAEDTLLNRVVALKALKPALAASASAKRRFVREAQASASMKHEHIITVYQVGEDRGVPFLAMEVLEGTSLEEHLKQGTPTSLGEILRIGREIAEGLGAAHQRGLIHRDIKPANIWLEAPRGHVKILDFGLVRGADDQAQITQPGAIVGTPAYMAPEQASGTTTDHRTDLYSLGCVLYRLCTGQLPFRGDTTMATLAALATETPKAVASLNPSIPRPLADLVMKLLSRKPSDRCQSAREVVAALRTIEERLPTSGPKTKMLPGRPLHRRLLTVLLVALIVGGGSWGLPQIIVRIKNKDGETEIKLPPGASVEVEKDGKIIAEAGTEPPKATGKLQPLSLAAAATARTTEALWGTPQEKLIFPKWGEQKYGEVPFHLIDPRDGKNNAIVLRAGWLAKNPYPNEASVTCGHAGKTIHLLTGVSGAGFPQTKEKSLAMVVRLHYADGGKEDHELLNAVHFANLNATSNVPESKQAFKLPLPVPGGPNGSWSHSQVRYLAITLKKTDAKIETIEFTKGDKGDITSPVVMAVTVEKP